MKAIPRTRYLLFLSLACGGCLVDLATKSWAFAKMGMPGQKATCWWIEGVAGLEISLNEGALFGLGQGWVWLFAVLSVVAGVGVFWWLFFGGAAHSRLLTFSLGCITAGIFGNLYDRLGLPGLTWNYANTLHEIGDPVYAVRDFIHVMIFKYPWPNFNVADSMLVCGAIVLGWYVLFVEVKQPADSGK